MTSLEERIQHKGTFAPANTTAFDEKQHVTFNIDGQLFAASMQEVGDIVDVEELTPVPKSLPVIRGLINVRGRIITMIDLRALFGQPIMPVKENEVAITYDFRGENYALAVDQVKDIINISDTNLLTNLPNLSKNIRACSRGIYRHENNLILVVSMNSLMQLVIKNTKNSKADIWAEIIEQSN